MDNVKAGIIPPMIATSAGQKVANLNETKQNIQKYTMYHDKI